MSKPHSPTRADRLLRIMRRNASKLREVGMWNRIIEDEEFRGDSIILDGQKLLNFGLCSYLALGEDDRLKDAAKAAVDHYGTSYSSSPYYSAIPLQEELGERLERVFDTNVIVTASTTMGHLAAIPVIAGVADSVLLDAQVHTSVVTATHSLSVSGVTVRPIPHNDMEALERAIVEDETSERIWYLTDGVFSMHGDAAPGVELRELLEKHPRLHVYCDDAHGFAWSGLRGRGHFLSQSGWHERLVVIVGLAKGFGSLGGALALPDADMADFIRLTGPGLMFGGPVPPASLGAGIAAADILLSDELPGLQAELVERIRLVNELSADIGLEFVSRDETPIWFHDVGEIDDMMRLLVAMREKGFYLNGSGFPAVPHGHAGIRFTITLANTMQQIEDLLVCLNETRLELFGDTKIVVDLEEARADIAKRPSG